MATATLDERDAAILQQRIEELDRVRIPRCGDYVRFNDGVERRISHLWLFGPDDDGDIVSQAQTSTSGSWYLSHGATSFSGGLFGGTPVDGLRRTDETKLGSCWFFHHDYPTAGGGVDVEIPFRVYETEAVAPA